MDIVQPDVTRVGGITEWMKIAHFASAHGLKVAPHGVQEIHTSLAAAIDNALYVEYAVSDNYMQSLMDKVFTEPQNTKHFDANGMISVSDIPGLGLEIDWAIANKYLVK